MLDDGTDDQSSLIAYGLARLHSQAPQFLRDRVVVKLLLDYPLEEPRLDPALLQRVLDGLGDGQTITRLEVYRLSRDELLDYGSTWELVGIPARLQ
jgi:hypothetical protein